MSEPISQAVYSVPIVRAVGSRESKIPEEFQYRVARSSIPYVRCPLFPGENLVKVTWGGPETVLVNAFDTATKTGYQAGVIPANSGGGGSAPRCSVSPRPATAILSTSLSPILQPKHRQQREPSPSSAWTPANPDGGGLNERAIAAVCDIQAPCDRRGKPRTAVPATSGGGIHTDPHLQHPLHPVSLPGHGLGQAAGARPAGHAGKEGNNRGFNRAAANIPAGRAADRPLRSCHHECDHVGVDRPPQHHLTSVGVVA